jgi:hypothetical protein
MRPSTVAAVLAALPGLALTAHAGIVSTTPYGYTTQYGGSFVAGSSSSGDISLTPSSLTSTVKGDVSFTLPYGTTSPGRWQSQNLAIFTVGVIPIEVTSMTYDMNYKLVLGNGDVAAPYASCYAEFYLRQAVDPLYPNPATDPILFGQGQNRWQYGNGYNVVDESFNGAPLNRVLGAGLTYYLSISIDSGISTFNGYGGYTQLSTTLEFGGPYSTGTYDGFAFTMNYHEVPAPGAATLLAAVGIAALRRRR